MTQQPRTDEQFTNDAAGTGPDERVRAAVERGLPTTIADLSALVRIPSVSWTAFDRSAVAESAAMVADLARGLGIFETVEVKQAAIPGSGELGQPAVLATRAARSGRPTVLLYAHHDVQPPGADELWESKPFEPTVRGDRLYGRGAADDKAGVMAHIASIRALAEVADEIDLGLALFIEGEEEFGSQSFATFLQENRDALAADVIIVADSDNWDTETPALTVGLRGNVTFTLTVRTLQHASHSGMFGGAVPDAMLAMVRLLASLHDADGAVAIDGLTRHEQETPEYSEERLAEEAALIAGVTPIGRGSVLSRLWAQPSLTVTGIDAPSVANASNTLSPEISARISVRVAPGQSAASAHAAIEDHLRRHVPFGAELEIDDVNLGDPFLVDTSGWAVGEVRKAMADAWGRDPVDTGIGGSIPFISDLAEVFPDAQILVTGVEDPDSRAHSPNESLHLGVFKRAVLTEALFLARLNAGIPS